ncbi:MAG: MBL fold metallo-hydrolase [Gammaproteobacteria bacterium]|nr:MBL fold metallo-hydrolase [Gammaproteobacteria bacterium]
MKVQFWGATEEVTGSCMLIKAGTRSILLDCGLFQGTGQEESQNRKAFPFKPENIDAVILSHAHIDHSGRIPLLHKSGFNGHIYTQHASKDLVNILLQDSAFLNEKDADIENRKRQRKSLKQVQPLYTRKDVQKVMRKVKGVDYDIKYNLYPEITFRLRDAGHILGSSIVELYLTEGTKSKKLCFSGDLGHSNIPILRNPEIITEADHVIMEATYGDRFHRSINSTLQEIGEIIKSAIQDGGNILIPSFAVGRTQEILYLFAQYWDEWNLSKWQIFLDSPMAIAATDIYLKHQQLYDTAAISLMKNKKMKDILPNLHISHTANQSMQLNKIKSGAIIIAGSGMCNGGRIKHHLKHNIWRHSCHIIIVGFQAKGTLGRSLVDGAKHIRLWGETITVNAQIHTVGGLSAHADQDGLLSWYQGFHGKPDISLVHGEKEAMQTIRKEFNNRLGKNTLIPSYGDELAL